MRQSANILSEPPLEYRQAAADAPVGEIGEDEYRKERRLKREARKKRRLQPERPQPVLIATVSLAAP